MTEPAVVAGPSVGRAGRRGVEFALLVGASVLVTVALVLVEAGQQHPISFSVLYVGSAFLALFAVGHLAVRRWAPYADPLILPCVAVLNGLGLVMIHRLDLAAVARAAELGEAVPSAVAPYQLAWTTLAMALFVAVLVMVRDHRVLARYGYIVGLVGFVLLVLPGVLPAGISEVNGAKLWIRVGPISIQPGEFAKIAIIVFVSALLVEKRDLFTLAGRRFLGMIFPRARDLAPLIAAWVLAMAVLALETELGASLLIFGVILGVLYIATARLSWVLIGLLFFGVGCVASYFLFSHVRVRVQVWSDPFGDYLGTGYQISQSLFGLGTGGLGGTGLGSGRPDLVPLANADFIAASFGEELGLLGLAAMLVLYLLLVTRGLRTALAVRDGFGKLLAAGLSITVALQVFIVLGGITNLIPETGLTTPFLSYGGSALLANYVLAALLIRISHAAASPTSTHRPRPPRPALAESATELVARPTE